MENQPLARVVGAVAYNPISKAGERSFDSPLVLVVLEEVDGAGCWTSWLNAGDAVDSVEDLKELASEVINKRYRVDLNGDRVTGLVRVAEEQPSVATVP